MFGRQPLSLDSSSTLFFISAAHSRSVFDLSSVVYEIGLPIVITNSWPFLLNSSSTRKIMPRLNFSLRILLSQLKKKNLL